MHGAEEVLGKIQRLATLALGVPASAFLAADDARPWEDPAPVSAAPDEFGRRVWQRNEPIIVPDAHDDPRFVHPPAGIRGYLGVPLRDRNGVAIGTLSVRDPAPRAWTPEEVELLTGLAGTAATELLLRRELGERRRAEEGLGDAEERFDSFMDHCALRESAQRLNEAQRIARLGSWEWHVGTDSSVWSDQLYRLLGREPGSVEPSGRVFMQTLHPDDLSGYSAALEVALARGTPLDTTFRVVHADGTVLHLHAQGTVDVDASGRAVRLAGTLLDVSERAAAAQAEQASEERYRQIVKAAGDIIYEVDPAGRFTYANPASLRILGYETGEVVGRHYSELVRPDYRPRAADLYARQVYERIPTTYLEFPAVARDGREIWIGQIVQIVEAGGVVRGLRAVARDISTRHEIERMKDEFISIVSHELRTPLTSIRGSLGLLGSGKLDLSGERARRLVEIARENTDRLIRLINDMLDIERIETGAIAMRLEAVSSKALVDQAVDTVRGLAERAGVTIETDVHVFELRADPDRVIQVLTNLISNAVKFSRADAGSVVSVEARAGESAARFNVTDRGRGIPADKLETIFERFQQVDSTDSREKGGTGLGLAISRSIVQQHGGAIRVESEPGQGSTFTFTIPFANPP